MPIPSITRAHLSQLLALLKPIAILPRAPFNLRALGGSSGNTLSWEDILRADGYELQMSANGDFSQATTVYSGNATSFSDVHITTGTLRWYRIRSYANTRQNSIVQGSGARRLFRRPVQESRPTTRSRIPRGGRRRDAPRRSLPALL